MDNTEPHWKSYVLLGLAITSTLVLFFMKPIPQPQDYHHFADNRMFGGIPNTLNVLSNLFFLLVGGMGIRACLSARTLPNRAAWMITFIGVTLVGLGSAYYHWSPNDQTLVWDRLPMTIAFMAFLSALLGEFLGSRITRILLLPLILAGIASVIVWHVADDLRMYAWVVFVPLLIIIALLLLFRSPHRPPLMLMLLFYIGAKLAEEFDASLYSAFGATVSGHSLKHLLAAGACFWMVFMVRKMSPPSLHG
jgi:hypothetical protein